MVLFVTLMCVGIVVAIAIIASLGPVSWGSDDEGWSGSDGWFFDDCFGGDDWGGD